MFKFVVIGCYLTCCLVFRKKGVLLLYKVFLKYPEALRPAFPKLKEKLEDPDPGVQVYCSQVVQVYFSQLTVYLQSALEMLDF